MLTLSFLQMYRVPSLAQTTTDLRARTREFGVSPCISKEIAGNTLRSMGANAVVQPPVRIVLQNVENQVFPQRQAYTPEQAAMMNSSNGTATMAALGSGGMPQFTVMGTANGLQPALATSRPPPEGTIGAVKRTTGYKWVIARIVQPNDPSPTALSWVPTTDESMISIDELMKMDQSFEGVIAIIDNNTRQQSFITAGIPLVRPLRAAVGGNINSIIACAKMLGNGICAPIPVNSISNDRPTPEALVAFISWLGAAVGQISPETTVGVSRIVFV